MACRDRLVAMKERLAGCRLHIPTTPSEQIAAIAMVWTESEGELEAADAAGLVELLGHPGARLEAHLVDERVQWDYERTWPDGDPSPGVKRISFLRRLPGLSRAEFGEHWATVHAPLARRHHPTLWRYVQNVVLEDLTLGTGDVPGGPGEPGGTGDVPGGTGDVDGVVELSFRSQADLDERLYDSDEGARIIGQDVRSFIDVAAGWRLVTTEHVLW